MSVYFVVNSTVTSFDKLDEYQKAVGPSLVGQDVKVLVSTNDSTTVEGTPAGARMVILEFPDNDAFRRWYYSDAYQAVINLRFAATDGFAVLAPGR
jgi:uncharacterized protein (DUF1330 family)